MLMEERRQGILEEINKKNIVYVKELSQKYSVTMETIRKDLEDIISENQEIKKVYGGALKSSSTVIDENYSLREELFSNQKEYLGKKAAELIDDDDCIFLDAGTTITKIIPFLRDKKNIKIVTVSIAALMELTKYSFISENNNKVYFIGGEVKLNLMSTSGTSVVLAIDDYTFDKAFLALDGISIEKGITSHNSDEALVTSEVMKNSKKNVFLATDEKIETSKFYKVCTLDKVDILITTDPKSEFLEKLSRNFNINIV